MLMDVRTDQGQVVSLAQTQVVRTCGTDLDFDVSSSLERPFPSFRFRVEVEQLDDGAGLLLGGFLVAIPLKPLLSF